jgi:transcriptional regulator with XRE-family HTH domain
VKELSKKIRLLRHQKSWSQEDVARRLKISIPAFSKIETGSTDLNVSRLEEIAQIFDMSLVQLLTITDSDQQKKHISDLEDLTIKLHEREIELLEMQKKIIELYEELRIVKV